MAKQSILVIDDEPAIRDMLQIALDAAGFKVELAEDAKQAYPIIIDTQPVSYTHLPLPTTPYV